MSEPLPDEQRNGIDPAYPMPCVSQNNTTGETVSWQTYGGLTKRELFAAMALQGLCGRYAQGGDFMEKHVASGAVKLADALLTALEQVKP